MVTIRELKEHIGQEAESIISEGMSLERVGTKYRCPNKAAHKHGDRTPSMSWDPKAYQFYCFTCQERIDLYKFHREQGLNYSEILKKYGLLDDAGSDFSPEEDFNLSISDLTESQMEYLIGRGISEETAAYFNLSDHEGNILIPYNNSRGSLTGAKVKNLKNPQPKYYSVKGSIFGLFNKSNLSTKEPLIITEGEFDSMILHQIGFRNVSSIGTGANSLDKLFRMEGEFLKKFPGLIVIADNDEAGSRMEQGFIKEFNISVKLPDRAAFKGLKDITDVFLKYGAKQIEEIIRSASQKIEGLRNLDTDPYKGLEETDGKYISTGLTSIDYAINDLGPGILTLVTGRSNGGKSTLINQIIGSAINTGHKCLLIAGEGLQEILINNLYKAVIGRDDSYFDFKKINKRFYKEPKKPVLEALKKWHEGKFTIFNKGDSKLKTTEELLQLMEMEIKLNKPDLVIVDNLMSILSIEKAAEKYEKQGDFAQRLSDIAKAYKIHIILVLHPNKTVSKGSDLDFEQISGSSDLYNKADVILAVKRNYDEEKLEKGIDGKISVLKNRYYPDLISIDTHYDPETGLILEIDKTTGDYLSYSFSWRQHLMEDIEASDFDIPDGFKEVQRTINWNEIG
jgi:twinkle protein